MSLLEQSRQGWRVGVESFLSSNQTGGLPDIIGVMRNNQYNNNTLQYSREQQSAAIPPSLAVEDHRTFTEKLRDAQAIYDKFVTDNWVRPNKGKCANPNIQTRQERNLTSSIEFVGCCGLGHRLARMAAAAHIAADLGGHFFGYWGCCDDVTSVYHHLFGTEPLVVGPILERSPSDKSQHHHLQFVIETPGMSIVKQKGKSVQNLCPVRPEKIVSDYLFYSQLRDHYQKKANIDAFINQHFRGKTAIGIHIRGGNGEKGDFKAKKRQIDDEHAFTQMLSQSIRQLVDTKLRGRDPPVLFVATDTHVFVGLLREALKDIMPVLDMPQIRPEPGKGVFFGEIKNVKKTGSACLDGWDGAVKDMILLSHADVLLIPKASSFTQTMPASLVMGKPNRIPEPFCELATDDSWTCFDHVGNWSCKTLATKNVIFDASMDYRPML